MKVDAVVVVEVVHREVHLSVSVTEDDGVHHQAVELLVGGSLKTSDGEGGENLSVESEVETRKGHRVG